MLTPPVLRAMRGALGWSMRDCAAAAGVALATVLKAEAGEPVSAATALRLRKAFAGRGVTVRPCNGATDVRIRDKPRSEQPGVPEPLRNLPYVVLRPRADGTCRILFEVPKRLRPEGWPAARPLPCSAARRGDLSDIAEMAAVRRDAARLLNELQTSRSRSASQDRR